jgi:hypothetical protein
MNTSDTRTSGRPDAVQDLAAEESTSTAHVLWTGGWDSTFRVLDLLLSRRLHVQPHYILDRARLSLPHEMRAMDAVRRALLERDPALVNLLAPTICVEMADIPENPAITAAVERLRPRYDMGSQYEWLSRYACSLAPVRPELMFMASDRMNHAFAGAIEEQTDVFGPYSRLREPLVDPDLAVFQPFRMPLYGYRKFTMEAIAREQGFLDILELSWFCHLPARDGSPCGYCVPCRFTRRERLGRRIPRRAHLRWLLKSAGVHTPFALRLKRLVESARRPRD